MAEPWSTKDKKEAVRLRKTGATYTEIGDAMGKTPAQVRGVLRRLGEAHVPDTSHGKVAAAKGEVTAINKRVKELEALVESQAKSLKEARAPRITLHVGSKQEAFEGDYCRVVVPDSHGCYIEHDAADAFLSDLQEINPSEVVMLGYHLDCGGFLAQHQTLGFVAEASYTFEQDVACCNQFLDEIQSKAPNARVHYLEGNHEARIEKWCITQSLRNEKDGEFLADMFSTEKVLSLEERNIKYYKQGKFYQDIAIPATIKLGHCYFTHGSRTGKHAASDMLRDFSSNVVFGHTHRADSYTIRTVEGIMGSWNPGCLCRLQRLWNKTNVSGWSHGYGLQLVRGNGEFLHINVPIIKGKSYLVPLLEAQG